MPIIVDIPQTLQTPKVDRIIERAGYLLQDEQNIRWTRKELIGWINEGVAEIISAKPSAGSRSAIFATTAGSLQKIDAPVIQLLDVVRNIGADGVQPGRVITRVDRAILDAQDPSWHLKAPSGTVRHYAYDDRLPGQFYVYPPATDGVKIEIAYSLIPEDITEDAGDIQISAKYYAALVSYVVFRAYSKDSEFADGNIAAAYNSAFQQSLGLQNNGEVASSPTSKVPA